MRKKVCDWCKIEVRKPKDLHKVKKEQLCKDCYIKNRLNYRNETIELTGIKEELNKLKTKASDEYRKNNMEKYREYARKSYHKRNPEANYYKPIIKINSKFKKPKSNCYLTLQEKQDLFKILINQGLSYEEADRRVKELIKNQRELRVKLLLERKSEEEIKNKQKEMIMLLLNK